MSYPSHLSHPVYNNFNDQIPIHPHSHPFHFGYNLSYPHIPDDIPRPSFFSYSPDVIKHRKRTSRSQRKILEEAFRNNPKPSQYTRKLLIHQTGMERRAIQVWFQNRRAKEKKLAAKASLQGPNSASPLKQESNDDDDDEEEEDEDKNLTEGPASPTQQDLSSSNDNNDVKNNSSSNNNPDCPSFQDSSDHPTPSPPDAACEALTPPATTSTSGSAGTNSPRPSSNSTGYPPSPPQLWPSHESTPALGSKHPLTPDAAYAMRRESAPAPLGVDFPRPSPFLNVNHQFHTAVATNTTDDRVTIWDGGTPPSPLSATDDVVSLRRGSLPSFSSHYPQLDDSLISGGDGCRLVGLPGLPSDPSIRRMSLERSRMRLASHPYAPQVAANNRSYSSTNGGGLADFGRPHGLGLARSSRPPLPHAMTAPSPTTAHGIPTPAQMATATIDGNPSTPNWDAGPILPTSPTDGFPSYVRPRRHGSYHSGMYNTAASATPPVSHRTYTEIVPGPLPSPNFSFGTAPVAPISENENGAEDDDTGTGTSFSYEEMQRNGSFASVASTGSSMTSAWYSDVQSNGVVGNEELETPTSWQPDVRRASCPAPFVYAFSGLQVNNEGQQLPTDLPLNASNGLSLSLEVSKQQQQQPHGESDPSINVEDRSPIAHETQMQVKMQGGCVTGYPENVAFYNPDGVFTQPNGFSAEEYGYPNMAGYEINPECIDSTPTTSNAPGIVYPFFHQ